MVVAEGVAVVSLYELCLREVEVEEGEEVLEEVDLVSVYDLYS